MALYQAGWHGPDCDDSYGASWLLNGVYKVPPSDTSVLTRNVLHLQPVPLPVHVFRC